MSTLHDAALEHRALASSTGKYHIIRTKRGYAVRCIIDGYIEAKCKTVQEAARILQQLNGNP